MSDEENRWKWNKFVEIGNTIHKMRGQVRILEAKRALDFADLLIENHFIPNLPIQDQQIYSTLLPKIAEYLDGNAEVFQAAVKEYFLIQHCKAGLNECLFDISFAPKMSGVQTGFTCDIFNGPASTRYFIKTHQHGPTPESIKSVHPPDTKELFVYTLLELIGVGPKVHFIIPMHGTKRTVYIATKDAKLTLLSHLTPQTANTAALLKMDLISRVLCLLDCCTNSSNCGQVGEKPMIIDFRIESQPGGYVKADILERVKGGNTEHNYVGLMRTAVDSSEDVKLEVVKEALKDWDLLVNMNRAEKEIDAMVQKWGGKMKFEGDLKRYVQDVKETVKVLMKS